MISLKESQIIEKLNQNNYSTWSFKLTMLLIKEDLYDTITAEPPNPETAEWNKKDNKARALINLFIDDSQIVYVKNLSTAKETWNTLKAIHERRNLSSKLYLLRKLYSSKLEERGNVHHHITKILEIVDRLKAIGEDIKESHIVALFLCSLPPSYETLITALEARPESELSIEFITNKLKDEYNRRRENTASNESAPKALSTINKKQYYSNNYKTENKFCTYCKRKNHNKSECYHLKNKNSNTHKKQNNPPRHKFNNTSLCFETQRYETNENPRQENHDEIEESTRSLKNNLAFLATNSNNTAWIIDSGSSSHITNNKQLYTCLNEQDKSEVIIANGGKLESHGSGEIELTTQTSQGEINKITLKNVLYVPDLESNLLSVAKATQNGCKIIFENDECKITYRGKTYLEGKLKNNLYELNLPKSEKSENANLTYQCNNKNCIQLWHRRTGHKNHDAIKEIVNKELALGIKISACKHDNACETCVKAKLTDMPYPKATQNRANKILQLIHSDVCGPMPTPTIGGKQYFLTVTDDYSRYTIIYLLTNKSEVATKLKEYVAFTKNKFGKVPEEIRTDNGKEYINRELEDFFKEMGIKHQKTVPYCPSQNGVAERKNRTLVEMVRSMLSDANLEKKFWGEALNTANYLINRLPTKANQKTPLELWTKRKPNLAHLKIFGCKAYAYLDKTKRNKLDNKSIEGIFVGYDDQSKGYRIYTGGRNITIARTVKFFENSFQNLNANINENSDEIESTNHTLGPETEEHNDTIEINVNDISETEQIDQDDQACLPRRSERINKGVPPDRFAFLVSNQRIVEPKSWKEIEEMGNQVEKRNWMNAAQEEIKSLENNKTWELVEPPIGKRVVGCKWTFKAKYNSKGEIDKYKARLVAKGYSQKFGSDYDETFAPVVTYTTIRAFLANAAYKGLKVNHLDIKTAFLHGNLTEEIYMSQPEGYIKPGDENKVCKLNKAIYGLKQAARAWNLKIGETLGKLGFSQSEADPCLFKRTEKGNITYIILYVDDLLVSGIEADINKIVKQLNEEYEIKNLGEVNYYLGINIERLQNGNFAINQINKINQLIEDFNLNDSKPTNTPMDTGYTRADTEENLLKTNTNYRKAIGSLLYIATITRPDISAAVNILSRRIENPRQMDWIAVKRVIRYLKTTKNLNLEIGVENEPILTVYTDSDWAGDKKDRKSTSGNLFKLGNCPIQWTTKKQTCVAMSSAEAEFVSAANAAQETKHILKLLEEMDLKQNLPIVLYEDNISTIKMINSDKFQTKTKHIDLRYHCIKHIRNEGVIELEYCPSKKMTADILTKALPKSDFCRHREELQLKFNSRNMPD